MATASLISQSPFSKFLTSVSSLWNKNGEKEPENETFAGLSVLESSLTDLLSSQDFSSAQKSVNQMPVQQIEPMDFFKQIEKLKLEDLSDKNNLYKFLLLFNHPADRIHRIFVHRFTFPGGGYEQLKILPLAECVCPCGKRSSETGKHPNNRLKVEDEILSQIEKRWENSKNDKLTLVSVGSGECLQEWVLLSKLLLMGYTNLEIHLLDPSYEKDLSKIKSKLPQFFSQFPGVQFDFHFHNSLEEFSSKNIETDVLMAIDWDICPDDKTCVPVQVSQNGFSYVNKLEPYWQNKAATQIISH